MNTCFIFWKNIDTYLGSILKNKITMKENTLWKNFLSKVGSMYVEDLSLSVGVYFYDVWIKWNIWLPKLFTWTSTILDLYTRSSSSHPQPSRKMGRISWPSFTSCGHLQSMFRSYLLVQNSCYNSLLLMSFLKFPRALLTWVVGGGERHYVKKIHF